MGDVVLAEGARGELVRFLQECLAGQGYAAGFPNGHYGFRTAAAVQRFQLENAIPATGEADAESWTAITAARPPCLRDRVLQLTAAFEGRSFTLAQGNCDGCGITWGILGFTLRAGEIQDIVRDAWAADRSLVERPFGDDAGELLELFDRPIAEQIVWADRHSSGTYKVLLSEPWRSHFRDFGKEPDVQAIQLSRIESDYFRPALETSRRYRLGSELGVALCFDIEVRDGGIEPDAAASLAARLDSTPTEEARRVLVATSVTAGVSRPDWRSDGLDRKLAIARGSGTVQGTKYSLRAWGLDETAAVA